MRATYEFSPGTKKILAGILVTILTFSGGLLGGVFAAGEEKSAIKTSINQNTKDIKRVETDMKATTARIEKKVGDVDKKLDQVILLLLEKK